jgi:hypothetical protein
VDDRFPGITFRQEYDYDPSSGTESNVGKWERVKKEKETPTNDSRFDRTIFTQSFRELPKLKAEATTQNNNIERINTAIDLVGKGVTGKGGQVKSFLAPYAEMIGVDSQNLNDAQKFELLTRVIIGPMRLDIVGPGPVSEWEQKLMQKMSGSGGAVAPAALELLNAYKKQAQSKVDTYNTTLDGLLSMDDTVGKIHKHIKPSESQSKTARRTGTDTATGEKVTEWSDGSVTRTKR